MTFRYTKITNTYYLSDTDEWEEDGIEFDYDVDDEDLLNELVYLIKEDYFDGNEEDIKKALKTLIKDLDLTNHLSDVYEDKLKDIFEQEALDSYGD